MKPDYDALAAKTTGLLSSEKVVLQQTTYTKENDVESLTCTSSSSSSREKWGKEIEFLLSCIALSVGLGNVWRFPFIALENGGGAFVIPYIIVLLLIGRPVYYMEVVIGQFCGHGCIKSFDMVPLMRGVAYGQIYATALATTYYACIMALTIKYLSASLSEILPWTYCRPEWEPQCIDSKSVSFRNETSISNRTTSAELYFTKTVLREKDNINDGIGLPNWDLVLSLGVAWVIIAFILIKGIRSSGKASYFLAIFPYIVMIILLIRAVTLPGSLNGIIYFLKPQWERLLEAKVWYAAITQMFFSLAICFGTLVMYASYNEFRKNIYKDVIIITTVDSFTSILAGCIIFGILGNLAYETKSADISKVVQGGAGLAFISYPEAIAKFTHFPQVFAILFFLMLLALGVGSNIGMISSVIRVIKDRFTDIPHWALSTTISFIGFLSGLVYLTPGGQFILNLVDFFGCSFIALFLAIAQLFAIGWIYGVKRFCQDIEFMFNHKTGIYWRICWAIITPGFMCLVLIYTVITYRPFTYKEVSYPLLMHYIAWVMWTIGVLQLPIWMCYEVYKQPGDSLKEKFVAAMKPRRNWGPIEPKNLEEYRVYRAALETKRPLGIWEQFYDNVFG